VRLTSAADSMLKFAPNKQLFQRPMSFGSRDLLLGLIEWSRTKLHLFGNRPDILMINFGKVFDQVKYENAEQTYDIEQYLKLVPTLKSKTEADILDILSLKLLFNEEWNHTNNIKRKLHVGDITQYTELYNWVVDKFVLVDFNRYDLDKIVEMGRLATLEVIKREAQHVHDPDKKSISYLYAIIRNVSSKDEVMQYRADIIDVANKEKLAQLSDFANGAEDKIPFKSDPDFLKKQQSDRELIDILRKLGE
jgi:hypothetical protein